ncbi:MAG: TonB-dependent receptor [Hyphomonadaceae bacterium]|nr:TonB-dependent receptor [Hyphomonadaceae bacterium]
MVGAAESQETTAQEDRRLDTVTVTARKQEETLQDVPLAVTAVSGVELEKDNIANVTDLVGRVPGLYFAPGSITNPTSAYTYLTMRGLGFNAGLEPSVGVFIDGMYQPQIGFDVGFLDLEQVEVLRGPQGTLFGRNTQGGAVNMVTRKPGPDFHGSTTFEISDFGTLRFGSAMSGPFSDNVFGSISAEYRETDGYVKNITTGGDQNHSEQVIMRGIVRTTPTEALDVSFIADASFKTYDDLHRGVPLEPERYESLGDEEGDDHATNVGVQLNVDYDFSDSLSFTSITGYRRSEAETINDTDGHPTLQDIWILDPVPGFTDVPIAVKGASTPYDFTHEFLSQELRLSGETDNLDWLVGAYFFNQQNVEDAKRLLSENVAFPFGVYIDQHYTEDRTGWAGFGQLNYRPINPLELTFGVRYSDEEIETGGYQLFALSAGLIRPVDKTGETDGDNVSILASASYDFTDDILGYLTYAEGWKAGGINRQPSTTLQVLPYEEETSVNYEIGLKSSFLDGRVSLNAALFYIEIDGLQLAGYIPDPNGGPTPVLAVDNVSDTSTSSGIEIELGAWVTDQFRFDASIATASTDMGEYTRFYTDTDQFEMTGRSFENIPDLTGEASLTYVQPLSLLGGGDLEAVLTYSYVSDLLVQDNYIGSFSYEQSLIPEFDRLNARVSYIMDNGWRVTGFVDNVLDTFDYTNSSSDPYPNNAYPRYAVPLEPRQVGLVVAKTF